MYSQDSFDFRLPPYAQVGYGAGCPWWDVILGYWAGGVAQHSQNGNNISMSKNVYRF
jgi:hypothetical protein